MNFGKSKHNKNPQEHLTGPALLAKLKNDADWTSKMKFVKEVFYPALCKATISIEDATQNLVILNSIMMEKFLAKMKETKYGDLDMESNLSPKDPKYEDLKALLHLFDDKNVFEAKELMEGMKGEIEQFKADWWKNKTLDELPTKWVDEL